MNRNLKMIGMMVLLGGCTQTLQIPFQTSELILRDTWTGTARPLPMLHGLTHDLQRKQLIEISGNGLYVRDPETGKVLRQVRDLPWMGDVAYRADDRLVTMNGRETFILSPDTFEVENTLPVAGLLTRDGSHVLSGTRGHLKRISTTTGALQGEVSGSHFHLFSEDATYAVDGATLVHVPSGQRHPRVIPDPGSEELCGDLYNFPRALSWNQEEQLLAVAFQHREVQVWNTSTWQKIHVADLLGCNTGVTGLHMEGNVLHFLSAGGYGSVDLKTGATTQSGFRPDTFSTALFAGDTWFTVATGHLAAHGPTAPKWLDKDPAHWAAPDQAVVLQLKAKYQDANHYTFDGTLQLNGQQHQIRAGRVETSMVEFKQSLPRYMDIHAEIWNAQNEWQGSLYARKLFEGSEAQQPSYEVHLSLNGAYYTTTIERKKQATAQHVRGFYAEQLLCLYLVESEKF